MHTFFVLVYGEHRNLLGRSVESKGERTSSVVSRWMKRRMKKADAPLREYLARRGETLYFVVPAGEVTAGDAFCRLGVGDSMVAAEYPDEGIVGSVAFAEVGQIAYTGGDGKIFIAFYPPNKDSLSSKPLKLYWTESTRLAIEFLKALGQSCRKAGVGDLCFQLHGAESEPKRVNWIDRVLRDDP